VTRPAAQSIDLGDTIAYSRVSTEDQAREEKSSLSDQRAAIEKLAAKLTRTLAPRAIFTDPGRSGQTAEDRPGFMAMVAYAQAHPRTSRAPGVVLVLNDSRFGRFRDPDEAAYWRVVLARAGWHVRFAEGDDTDDLVGRSVLRAIGGAQASAYSHALRANAKRGTRAAAAKGLWQNKAPLGYRRIATRPGEAGVILEHYQRKADDQETRLTLGPPEEVELVRWMFTSYAAGEHTLGSLARECYKRWPVGKKWSRPVVDALLTNETYLGDVIWCRRPHDAKERAETPVRAKEEWVVTRDAHPAIISRDLFDAVQLRKKRNAKVRRHAVGGYPLSGLLTCTTCGKAYVGGGGPKNHRDPSDPDRYRFYRDAGALGTQGNICPGRVGTLSRRMIEPAVVAEIAKVVAHPGVQALIGKEIDRVLAETGTDSADRQRSLTKERAELEARRANVVSAIARGVLSDADAVATLAELRAKLEGVTATLERTRFGARAATRLTAERDRLISLAADFGAAAQRLSGQALRELLVPWLAGGMVDKNARTVTLWIRRVPALGPFLTLSRPPAPGLWSCAWAARRTPSSRVPRPRARGSPSRRRRGVRRWSTAAALARHRPRRSRRRRRCRGRRRSEWRRASADA
jgi:DNA invertase Pin-like site-specific DNA recombinase